jgi:Rv2632c-like
MVRPLAGSTKVPCGEAGGPCWRPACGGRFAGGGEARLNPADQDIWMIGAQIAAARLVGPGRAFLHAAATGIEAITHERAQLNL